jgi:hypothetical protein
MIQGILCFQFKLNQDEAGDIDPEFKPIKLIFNNKEFSEKNFAKLIVRIDIFGVFYQHITGTLKKKGIFSNFYVGRLKKTPYQVISYFRQENIEAQFLTIAIFQLDDEIEIYEELIKKMASDLDPLFPQLAQTKVLEKIESINDTIETTMKFALFQVERLSQLDPLQKVALIFNNKERLKILELLRERPYAKKEIRDILENMKPNPNVDLLIEPFIELNLVRRDWIKGDKKQRRLDPKQQGEFLFLVKDIVLVRLPSESILKSLKESRQELHTKYKIKLTDFFSKYDIIKHSIEEAQELASCLLNPDCFDFFTLMKSSYYPLKKIPKILSEFVDTDYILNTLEKLDIITKITDKDGEGWVILLTDIVPMVIFPEYNLTKILDYYKSKDREKKISYNIAKKNLELLEITYPDKTSF